MMKSIENAQLVESSIVDFKESLSHSKIFQSPEKPLKEQADEVRDFYSLLNQIREEIDLDMFIQNIFIIGNKDSGRSSILETITGLDLFRSNFTSKKFTKPLKILFIGDNQTEVVLNNKMKFASLEEFYSYLSEMDNEIEKILMNSYGLLEMTVHGSSQLLGFNCNIYRMTVEEFKESTLDAVGNKSTMFLLCTPCSNYLDMKNLITTVNEKINANNNLSERVLCLYTKSDKLDKTQSYQMIIEQETNPKVKTCFIRCRSKDDKVAHPEMKGFYKAETNFYMTKIFRCHSKCYFGSDFVINFLSLCVLKNLTNPEQMNESQMCLRFTLEELEAKMRENQPNKTIIIQNLKVALKYSINLCQFHQNILVDFLQKMFNVNTISGKESIMGTYIKDELNKLLSRPLPNLAFDFVKKLNQKMLDESELITSIFQEYSLTQIERDIISLKRIFRSYFDMNMDEIKKKIVSLFPIMSDDFIATLYSIFEKISNNAFQKASDMINAFDEVEKNFNTCTYYFRSRTLYEKYSILYKEISLKFNQSLEASSNIQGEKFYALINEIIKLMWKEKVKLLIENYVKIFYSNYFNSMKASFNECSAENLYNEKNLGNFKEREETNQKNNQLNQVYEITSKLHCRYKNLVMSIHPKESIEKLTLMSMSKFSPEDDGFARYEPVTYEDNFNIVQNPMVPDLDISRENEEPGSFEPSFSFSVANRSEEIVMIWDSTNEISVFNIKDNKIILKDVPDLPQEKFLDDNRYINFNDSVFIIGGKDANQEPSNVCLELRKKGNTYEVIPMPDFPDNEFPPYRHSLLMVPNNPAALILVGCMNSKKSFIYSLTDKKWEYFGDLHFSREDCTLALANNSIAFCIGGLVDCNDDDLALNSLIEYKNLNSAENWDICTVNYDNSLISQMPKIGRIYGCGIIPYKSSLIILGGLFQKSEIGEDSENENNLTCYEMKVSSSMDHSEVTLYSMAINNSAAIKSWFVESNFTRSIAEKDCLFNFNVDGEIVKFKETAKNIEIEEYTFI